MRTFQATSAVTAFIGNNGLFNINGFQVSVSDTKTGPSTWVGINSVP